MGLFEESYSQCINASFQFLCPDGDSNCFSLKDLIHRGTSILTFLNLDVDKDSNFAVMDLFRLFDRSGRGNVFLEDFVLGIIEKVNTLHEDLETLQKIADHMLQVESRCTELATLLEKGSSSDHFAKFNLHLKAHSHPIRTQIRSVKTAHNLSALDRDTLVRIFRTALTYAVADATHYFRLSNSRLAKLVTKPTIDASSSSSSSVAGVHGDGASSSSSSSSMLRSNTRSLWALVTAVPHGTGHGYQLNTDATLSGSGGGGGGGGDGGHGDGGSGGIHDGHSSSSSAASSALDHYAGSNGLGHLLRDLQASQLLPLDLHSALHRTVAADTSQLHVLQDALLALNNLFTLRCFGPQLTSSFDYDVLALPPSNAAFAPINNNNSNQTGEGAMLQKLQRQLTGGGGHGSGGGGGRHGHPHHHGHHGSGGTAINPSDAALQAELTKKVHEYRALLHAIPTGEAGHSATASSSSTAASSSSASSSGNATAGNASGGTTSAASSSGAAGSSSSSATAASGGAATGGGGGGGGGATATASGSVEFARGTTDGVLESALAAQLLTTQEELLRCRRRMSVLELLQTQVVSEAGLNALASDLFSGGSGATGGGGGGGGGSGGGAQAARVSPSAEDMARKFLPFSALYHESGTATTTTAANNNSNTNSNTNNNKRRKALLSAISAVPALSPALGPDMTMATGTAAGTPTGAAAAAAAASAPFSSLPFAAQHFASLTTSAEDTSFDRILQELQLLGAALAERASEQFPLGLLLECPQAVLIDPRDVKLPPTIFLQASQASQLPPLNANTNANAHHGASNASLPTVASQQQLLQRERSSRETTSSTVPPPVPPPASVPTMEAVPALLQSCDALARDLHDELRRRVEAAVLKDAQSADSKLAEQRTAEQSLHLEQAEFERNEFLALSVEMQVLREKAQKNARDEVHVKQMEARNAELTRRVRDLEEQVQQWAGKGNNNNSSNSGSGSGSGSGAAKPPPLHHHGHHHHGGHHGGAQNPSQSQPTVGGGGSGTGGSGTGGSGSGGPSGAAGADSIAQWQQKVAEWQKKYETQANELETVAKENQRLKSANKVSEQRVKSALQDQMALHHQIQALEEEVMVTKTTITKLTRELEEQRGLRSFKEDAERRMFDLTKELGKRDVEFAEAKETASLANKYHNDLIVAERAIETLEQRVAEYAVELEKGAVAVQQLENYREQLRAKTKEIRDLSLHIHGLESQLKDVGYLQHRVQELSDELQDAKLKGEKIPGLLAEIARLRGGTRASIKALAEQDKLLSHQKSRVKALEKENALLRNDNRALQDVELKLKESHAEVKRLLTIVNEVQQLKMGVRNAEEEKKSMEHQYKKMRKFMNQSVLINNTTGGAAGGSGGGGADGGGEGGAGSSS
eukprot:gene11781-8391_t